MRSENFIRCCNCQAIHHVTPFDKSPVYTYVGNELREEATDDRRRFFQQHTGHTLEALKITGEQFFPSSSPADPMSTGYIEVTNGRERFVLRRTRTSIEEPLTFELMSGRLNELEVILEVQENAIRNEMKYHFQPDSDQLTDNQIDLFIRLVKQVVEGMDVVQRIGKTATGRNDRPVKDIVINSVQIVRD